VSSAQSPRVVAAPSPATDVTTVAVDEPEEAWAPRWVLPLPWLLIATSAVLELATPAEYSYSSLMSAATPLAALLYRPRWTVVTGLVSFAVMVALWLDDRLGSTTGSHSSIDVGSLLLVVSLAVGFSFARAHIQRRLHRVRAVAEAAQRALLRTVPARLGPVRLAGFYRAADAEALVGGDLYSALLTPHGVRVIVGDVRGKGLGAVATVATVLSTFREAALVQESLTAVAGRIEHALALETAGSGDAELFVTAVLLEFPQGVAAVRVLNRGHPPVLVLGPDGAEPLPAPFGLPLGLGGLADPDGADGELLHPLRADRLLVAYSDGITEAADAAGVFYPLADRLAARFGGPTAPEPVEVAAFVEQDVARWAPLLKDDMTTLVLCRPDR
jgi:hypothetical protein